MRKHLGKILAMTAIVLGLVVAILFVVAVNQYLKTSYVAEETEQVSEEDSTYYDNGWDKQIVEEIAEDDIPIPVGFEYVQGTKDTGFIVQDTSNGTKMIWIPYDENANVDNIETYYQNTQYQEVDSSVLSSIEKYGGFYTILEEISQYENLKVVSQQEYETAKETASQIYQDVDSVNSHLISLFELQQVIGYGEKLGIQVTQTAQETDDKMEENHLVNVDLEKTVQKLANSNKTFGLVMVTVEEYSTIPEEERSKDNQFLSGYVTINGKANKVPIPQGFKVSINNVANIKNDSSKSVPVIKIVDVHNPNLIYIWVPVNDSESIGDIQKAQNKLQEKYNNASREMDNTGSETDKEYNELLKSIKQYGGFYMAEAELGFDNTGVLYNKMRGMENNYANLGDYFRTITKNNFETKKASIGNLEEIYQKYGLTPSDDGGYQMTYKIAKEIASNVYDDSSSVVSHLTYGSEWDTTVLWIIKTNEETGKLITDSRNVPGCKYKLDDESQLGTLEESKMRTINGLYGMAGNLFDLTQESGSDGKYRIRGGAFSTAGNETPVASRALADDGEISDKDDIGFRNCLYIKTTGEYKQDETQDPSETTIINVPIDSRPISRNSFADVVEAAGFNYIEIDQGLDSTTEDSSYEYDYTYVRGDSQKTRDALANLLPSYNNENTTVIINTSSYWFDGLISTRSYSTYSSDETKNTRIEDLKKLIQNNQNAKYYINITIPRTKFEERIERYEGIEPVWWSKKEETGLEYFYHKYDADKTEEEKNSYKCSQLTAIWEWEYLYYYKQIKGETEFNQLPDWVKEFYNYLYYDQGDIYQQVLNDQSQLHGKVYEYFEELVKIKNDNPNTNIELIVNIDDSEAPEFIKQNKDNFEWIAKNEETNQVLNLSGAYQVERWIEEYYKGADEDPIGTTYDRKNYDYILKEGQDEINHLILARECVRKSDIQIDYRMYDVLSESGVDLRYARGDYDAYTVGETIDRYMKFINEASSSNVYAKVKLYLNSKEHSGEMSDTYAAKCAETVKASLDSGEVVGVVDFMQNNQIDQNYFNQLLYHDCLGRVVYGGWNTMSNGLGINMGQTAVYAILQQQANTTEGLSENILKRTAAFSRVRIRNVIENGIYNANRGEIYSYAKTSSNKVDILENLHTYIQSWWNRLSDDGNEGSDQSKAYYIKRGKSQPMDFVQWINGADVIQGLRNATNEICGATYTFPFDYEIEFPWHRNFEVNVIFK